MAKKKVTDTVAEVLKDFLAENGFELYHCEFTKEGRDYFLRAYIDKRATEGAEEYVSTDDCELVSRFLSQKLDELDPIEQNYFLEVSSPGLDRTLYEEKDFNRFAGRRVELSLYRAVDGKKNFCGTLKGWFDGNIVMTDDDDKELKFPAEQVAKACLAVVF